MATGDDHTSPPGSILVGRPSRSAAASAEASRARVQSMSRLERVGLALALGRRHAELMRLRRSEHAG
jgi:hypothetical protein